jgi:hypothetical protein
MKGTNASTGKPLEGIDHLRQSVRDILTTAVGSRVMRRTYGAGLLALQDAPLNRSTVVAIVAAAASALARWEPRIQVERIAVSSLAAGTLEMTVTGVYLPEGQRVAIDGIKVN